ncbi:hypothetical protein FPOAC1_011951 [Fusarium poae]|uniref:hypothetical protein n=1 Tax=Fusarium poae TaxID=36050 RepID=UPI001CEA7C89|nr:hypothetical protein FPOAC1_011951 [Fusarium poae]KAG8667129.1 hypothetical protein FPOAC1_011951 [Fusarium poae]
MTIFILMTFARIYSTFPFYIGVYLVGKSQSTCSEPQLGLVVDDLTMLEPAKVTSKTKGLVPLHSPDAPLGFREDRIQILPCI